MEAHSEMVKKRGSKFSEREDLVTNDGGNNEVLNAFFFFAFSLVEIRFLASHFPNPTIRICGKAALPTAGYKRSDPDQKTTAH